MPVKRRRTTVAVPEDVLARAEEAGRVLGMRTLNRVVEVALREFAESREREIFAQAMAEMAMDPQIVKENEAIAAEFRTAESDGLPKE